MLNISDWTNIVKGVPQCSVLSLFDWTNIVKVISQCSILSLLLFNIFINDLFFFSAKREICSFADDNSLYSCGMNLDNMIH